MQNIIFFNGESWESDTLHFKGIYTPVYMQKNGENFFLWNESNPARYGDAETQTARKNQLLENGGKFFKFYDYSENNSPIDFLMWVKLKNLHLQKGFTAKILSDGKTFDFHGNLKEISCAFFYRVFDVATIETIKNYIGGLK